MVKKHLNLLLDLLPMLASQRYQTAESFSLAVFGWSGYSLVVVGWTKLCGGEAVVGGSYDVGVGVGDGDNVG